MPISTNLNASPYFDDFSEDKEYYKVLFKPSTSVQVRELNQLQQILQNQIEKFGDNIFKRGTIIDGCNFQFNNRLPYVKLLDNETDNSTVVPSLYVGNFVRNNSNLTAMIVNSFDGFEATSPDLKTIYVNYINSGNDFEAKEFTVGETLTIYSPRNIISKIDVINGGTAFSNSDIIVISPVISVTETSGEFVVGDFIVDGVTPANLQIVQIDRTTLALQNRTLIKVKPRLDDLISPSSNSSNWNIGINTPIRNQNGTVSAVLDEIFGEAATARIITDAAGGINEVSMTSTGQGYIYTPIVSVRSPDNNIGVSTVDLQARNYLAKINISSEPDSVGFGYAFGITSGTIYQKGHFLKANSQNVIVSKYDTQPNNLAIGFSTREEIINSNEDTSLLDNALGTENETAPGADRLKLIPELFILPKEEAASNTDFLPLVEWNDGNPYKQNQVTQYNRIGNEIAKGVYDSAGNFVLDTFQVTTTSVSNSAQEGLFYTAVVDPGQAYISGKKVQIQSNYKIDLSKGLDTKTSNNIVSLNYGNYIKIKEVGGSFQFNTGDTVKIYDSPKSFLSNTSLIISSNTAPIGNEIGTARMRSLVYFDGSVGTANCVYKLYLFDIKMNSSRTFADAKTVYYDGVDYKGIADVVLETDATTDNQIAKIYGTNTNRLLFPAGVESLKNSNNTNYTYRTVFTNTISNTGTMSISIADRPNEFFPYTGNLSSAQKLEFIVTPIAGDLIANTNLEANVAVDSSSNVIVGDGGSNFLNNFVEGDYVYAATPDNATSNIRKVIRISNSTSMTVDGNFSFSNNDAILRRVFPNNVPIPFGRREGLDIIVDSGGNIINLDINYPNGSNIAFLGTTVNTNISFNVKRQNVTSAIKTANRNKYVKISVGNNVSGAQGPWSIGVPDIFRLRNVYIANTINVNTASPKVTSSFYIDHNQTANYLGLGYLYLQDGSSVSITSSDFLLVEFDYYTRDSEGYFDTVSYLHTANAVQIAEIDSKPLSDLASESNSFEIPEVYTYNGEYYDLLNQFDFRPSVVNTVTATSDSFSAPINPSETETFSTDTDKKFPFPDSTASMTVEQYVGRIDDVYISEDARIYVLKGIPDVNPRKRLNSNHPKDSLRLQTFSVPSYPTIAQVLSSNMAEILNKRISNERNLNIRIPSKAVMPIMTTESMMQSQPMVYTMEDIGNLERRIKDLEYYVSLSILETNITNKIIPSSVNGKLNRFKFGFFADDFSTTTYSETSHPQYSASIESEGDTTHGSFGSPTESSLQSSNNQNLLQTSLPSTHIPQKATNRIVPPKYIWSVDYNVGLLGGQPPYIDEVVISQSFATDPDVITDPCVPNIQVVTVTTNTVSNALLIASRKGFYYSTDNEDDDDDRNKKLRRRKKHVITFGNVAGPASLYFYTFRTPDKISIYQGNTLIAGSFANMNMVQDLSNNDVTFLSTNTAAQQWFENAIDISKRLEHLRERFNRIRDPDPDFVFGVGKITWNHNPLNGNDYYVVFEKYRKHRRRRKFLVEYPTVVSQTTTVTVDVANCTIVNPPPTIFTGSMTVRGIQAWSCSNQFKTNLSQSEFTAFVVDVTGLKPLTMHKFYMDGIENVNVAPRQWGRATTSGAGFRLSQGTLGEKLISDKEGKLSFTVYIPLKDLSWVVNALGLSDSKFIYSNVGFRKTQSALYEELAKLQERYKNILTKSSGDEFNKLKELNDRIQSQLKQIQSFTYGSSGYSLLEVKNTSSYAKMVVANRTPDKVLPYDSKGNV
jgi:hypothetical protein